MIQLAGKKDIQDKILRAPDERFFIEDPLRFYRVMQFIGRFEMMPDKKLNDLCSSMNIEGVSVERIEGEFEKLLLRSKNPSLGIRWLRSINRLHEVLPEVADTIGIVQDLRWHPEGDVYEHSLQTLDAAARFQEDDQFKKLMLLYAGLCHDLGKVSTTEILPDKIISYGHAQAGAKLAKKMLQRFTRNHDLIEGVTKLVDCHMQPIQMVVSDSRPGAYKRLAKRLAPETTIAMLAKLVLFDQQGRNPQGHEPLAIAYPEVERFLEIVKKANVLDHVEEPVLQGRDLLDCVKPGPKLGKLLKEAYAIQIDEGVIDKEELKRRVLGKK